MTEKKSKSQDSLSDASADQSGNQATQRMAEAISALIRQIGTSKEARDIIGTAVPEALRLWAESGPGAGFAVRATRNQIAKIGGSFVGNAFLDKQGMAQSPSLRTLGSDPEMVQATVNQVGALLDGVFDILNTILDDLHALGMDKKAAVFQALFTGLIQGRSGASLTRWCRMAIEIHKHDPDFLANALQPGFEKWVKNLDFAELKDYVDTAAPGISRFAAMLNRVLWEYPAKNILLISLFPSFINIAVDTALQSVRPLNTKTPPDLLADVMLSLMQEADGQVMGELINELAEVTRKLHTGSALIGEPGSPQLPKDLAQWLGGLVEALDPEVLGKARVAVAEIKEAGSNAATEVMVNRPELMAEMIRSKSAVHNAGLRATGERLDALEEQVDDPVIDTAAGQAIEGLDAQKAADIVNTAAMLVNHFCDTQEAAIAEKAAAFADALDTYEVSDALSRLGKITGRALLPMARTVAPHIADGFLNALEADADEADDVLEDTIRSTRNRLRTFFNTLMEGESS